MRPFVTMTAVVLLVAAVGCGGERDGAEQTGEAAGRAAYAFPDRPR